MTIEEAERVAASFGLTARARPLGSRQDCNFLLLADGAPAGVLKIANPAFSAAEIEARDAAAELVRDAGRSAAWTWRAPTSSPARWTRC